MTLTPLTIDVVSAGGCNDRVEVQVRAEMVADPGQYRWSSNRASVLTVIHC